MKMKKKPKPPPVPKVLFAAIAMFLVLGLHDGISAYLDQYLDSYKAQEKAHYEMEQKYLTSNRIDYMARVFMHWNPELYRRKAVEYASIIYDECVNLGIPFEFIVAQIIKESTVREYAKGSSGEIGLLQIMPFWLEVQEDLGFSGITERELYDPENNIRMGIRILNGCLKRSGGDVFKALCYYNAGYSNDGKAGAKYARKVLSLANNM